MRRPRGLSLREAFSWFMPGEPPSEGCWEWTGARRGPGRYGALRFQGKLLLAHRVAYELYVEPIPEGVLVLHDPAVCNNPPCCNPAHLRLGTHQDNNLTDRRLAGTFLEGERLPQSKLTEDDVREIRRRYAAGGVSQTKLAQEYGVTQLIISRIARGLIWKHVE